MRICMNTIAAGPTGVWLPGAILDLPAAQAEELIALGYAERAERLLESMAAPDDGERATTRARARRARKGDQ